MHRSWEIEVSNFLTHLFFQPSLFAPTTNGPQPPSTKLLNYIVLRPCSFTYLVKRQALIDALSPTLITLTLTVPSARSCWSYAMVWHIARCLSKLDKKRIFVSILRRNCIFQNYSTNKNTVNKMMSLHELNDLYFSQMSMCSECL